MTHEEEYRQLRSDMEHAYSTSVGPRSITMRRRQIERRAAAPDAPGWIATGAHARTAARDEERLERDLGEYESMSVRKTCLAILTGRYDAVLDNDPLGPCTHYEPMAQALLTATTLDRRATIASLAKSS